MTPKSCFKCYGQNKDINILESFNNLSYGHSYCKECRITFDNNINEVSPNFEDLSKKDITLLDKDEYKKYFIETSDITDGEDNIYTDFDWSNQDDLKDGVVRHVLKDILTKYGTDDEFTLLDIGCGDGFSTLAMSNYFKKAVFTAVDPSPKVKQIDSLDRISSYQGILQHIDFKKERFDVIVIIGNLMLHSDPLDTLKCARDLLKSDGLLIFDFKNIKSTVRILALKLATLGIKSINNNDLMQRNFLNMRYGYHNDYMREYCNANDIEVIHIKTKPPRLLEFQNKSTYSMGLKGLVWKFLDRIDLIRNEQAWSQFLCVKK